MSRIFICDECNPMEAAELCATHGFGIEVQAFYDPSYIERERDAVRIHKQAIDGIADRAFHGPFGDLCAGSFDTLVRDLARKRFDEAVSMARELDIERIVLHHGYVPGTSRPSAWLARSTLFWRDLLDSTPPAMHFHLENVLERDPSLLFAMIAAVGDPRLDICLDIGHAHCHSTLGVVKWIEELGNRIGYVHLHDNHGESDEHLGLGEGTIEMVDVCHALNEYAPEATWGLEVAFEKMTESIDWLANHGFI